MKIVNDKSFEQDLYQALGVILTRAGSMKTPFQVIGELARSSILENFRQGGRPDKWEISQRAEKESGQTLVDRGALKGSISYYATDDSLSIGSNLVKAPTLQFGDKERNIPARPFILFQDEDIEQAKKVIIAWMEGRL